MADSRANVDEAKTLHARLVDSRNGYEEGLSLATDAIVVATFRDLLEMRQRHIAELDAQLRANGEAPDDDGSWMTPIHEAIMTVRSWFGGLDTTVLNGVIDGEERILEQYDKCLEETSDAGMDAGAIPAQRQELTRKIQQLKSIAAGIEGSKS